MQRTTGGHEADEGVAQYALEMTAKVRAKRTLNETLWSAFRWRIRRNFSDGSIQRQVEMRPLRGAAKRTSSRFSFHDTEP